VIEERQEKTRRGARKNEMNRHIYIYIERKKKAAIGREEPLHTEHEVSASIAVQIVIIGFLRKSQII